MKVGALSHPPEAFSRAADEDEIVRAGGVPGKVGGAGLYDPHAACLDGGA